MTMIARARSTTVEPSQRRSIEARIADPSTGEFMRRRLRRELAGVVAIGPTQLYPPPPPAPTRADDIRVHRHRTKIEREHKATVEAEIAAVDEHLGLLDKLLAVGAGSEFRLQEAGRERRLCRELRAMLADDLAAGPITVFPDGRRPVDDRMRAIVRADARRAAERRWEAAGRADAAGLRREATSSRVGALRSRLIEEFEHGLRRSLPGYTTRWD